MPSDPATLLAAAQSSQATAWRELALHWNVAIGEGDPCVAATQAQLACFRSAAGGLPLLRQLARPAWLTLRGNSSEPVYVLLLGLGEQRASLQAGRQRFELSLPALARIWRGEFSTYWRMPPGWREGREPEPQLRAWVAQQLGTAGVADGPPLAERVRVFQLAQGLPADGVAGPMTLMRLSRVAVDDEPLLATLK